MTLNYLILLLGLSWGLQAQEALRHSPAFDSIRSQRTFASTYPIGQFGDTILVWYQWTVPQVLGFDSKSLQPLFRKNLYVNIPFAANEEVSSNLPGDIPPIVDINFDTLVAYPQGFLAFYHYIDGPEQVHNLAYYRSNGDYVGELLLFRLHRDTVQKYRDEHNRVTDKQQRLSRNWRRDSLLRRVQDSLMPFPKMDFVYSQNKQHLVAYLQMGHRQHLVKLRLDRLRFEWEDQSPFGQSNANFEFKLHPPVCTNAGEVTCLLESTSIGIQHRDRSLFAHTRRGSKDWQQRFLAIGEETWLQALIGYDESLQTLVATGIYSRDRRHTNDLYAHSPRPHGVFYWRQAEPGPFQFSARQFWPFDKETRRAFQSPLKQINDIFLIDMSVLDSGSVVGYFEQREYLTLEREDFWTDTYFLEPWASYGTILALRFDRNGKLLWRQPLRKTQRFSPDELWPRIYSYFHFIDRRQQSHLLFNDRSQLQGRMLHLQISTQGELENRPLPPLPAVLLWRQSIVGQDEAVYSIGIMGQQYHLFRCR